MFTKWAVTGRGLSLGTNHLVSEGGIFCLEFSEKTFRQTTDHKVGGTEIAPGAFYVEMVLEASGLPCTVTSVEFKSVCKIPSVGSGGVPTTINLVFTADSVVASTGESRSFVVKSFLSRARIGGLGEVVQTERCTGSVIKSRLLGEEGKLNNTGLQPQAFGLLGEMELVDIGLEGERRLKLGLTIYFS